MRGEGVREVSVRVRVYRARPVSKGLYWRGQPWDESKHPREPAGAPGGRGGQFTRVKHGVESRWPPLRPPSGEPPTPAEKVEAIIRQRSRSRNYRDTVRRYIRFADTYFKGREAELAQFMLWALGRLDDARELWEHMVWGNDLGGQRAELIGWVRDAAEGRLRGHRLTRLRRYMVEAVASAWEKTSLDNSVSQTLQNRARELFGLTQSREISPDEEVPEHVVRLLDYWLRCAYQETQERLRAAGIKTVRVYRGTYVPAKEWQGLGRQEVVEWQSNPLCSWTTRKRVAAKFAMRKRPQEWTGLMLSADVPVERVVGISGAGLGTDFESEVVVLGGTDTVHAISGLNVRPSLAWRAESG